MCSSNRAGRNNALSNNYLRLVMPMSNTSMTMKCNELLVASPLHAASSASASTNNARTSFSLPPTQRSNRSGVDIFLGDRALNALDISRAKAAFPHPGGP